MAFVDKLVLIDTHANPDAQRDNLAPDISVYTADNVPDNDTKTYFSKMELLLNSNLQKHLIHSMTQGTHEWKTFALRMIQMFLN